MKKILIAAVALALAVPALAAQQDIAQLSAVTASREALRTAVNTQLSAVQANFDELYTAIGTRPWVIQATAPADTTLAWFDTDQVVDAVVLKIHNGERWVPQAIGEGGSYTLPTAAIDTLGGIKVGDRLTITDGVLSADVQTTDISGKENSLGNPSTNGYVLSSTTSGVRSWIEMTGGGTGIAHATSDGNYYASKDGAWATLAGVFQPADADLTSAAGGGAAGNSKLFGTNSSGVVGWYDIPGAGSGIAHATADGKWYGSKDGAWVDLAPTFSSALPKWIDMSVGYTFTAGDLTWYNGQVWKASGTHSKVLGEYPDAESTDWEDYIQAPIVVDYPTEVGVPAWTAEGWAETSYTVGTAANNLVQLNASAQLPAVSADLLTITDTGTYFTTDTVGAALNKLGSELAEVTQITLDASLTETGGVLSVTNPVTDYDTDGDGDFTDESWFPAAGIGGSTGSTDNAILRANGTGGSTAQASGVTIDDNDNVTVPGTIKGRTLFNSYAADQTLTAATHNSTVVQATEPIEITLWDCEAANVGDTVLLWARDAEKIEVAPATGDGFALFDGTPLTAGNELDVAATKGTKVTLMCTADDLWSVFHETAPATDGGVAD